VKRDSAVTIDYVRIYDLERYLFTEVGPRFVTSGKLNPADFYMIVIWKANRAKTKIRNRLEQRKGGFASSVKLIAEVLHQSTSPMKRLEVMMKNWDFALPMATAVLTVLYPNDFTVYDIRVCGQLKGEFEKLANLTFSPRLWTGYQNYLAAVKHVTPESLSLRDKDRYLWGKSFFEGVERDLRSHRV
jgi:hypothetical protein